MDWLMPTFAKYKDYKKVKKQENLDFMSEL